MQNMGVLQMVVYRPYQEKVRSSVSFACFSLLCDRLDICFLLLGLEVN